MHSSVKTFIDFDGTLVLENSSAVLIQHLLDRPQTRLQKVVAAVIRSPFGWVITKPLGILTRLSGEKDITLLVMLNIFQSAFTAIGSQVFHDVAAELTLNPALVGESTEPFVILSVGLEPVIAEFIKLHPELKCVGIHGSKVRLQDSRVVAKLEDFKHKLEHLSTVPDPRYFTDYQTEALIFQMALTAKPTRILTLPQAGQKTLYLLENI